jgi:hypothetical protein
MLFPYDLWRDVPWKCLGDFHLRPPIWVIGNQAIPFWWPVGLPLFSEGTKEWVYPVAAANVIMILWFGLRIGRFFRICTDKQAPE